MRASRATTAPARSGARIVHSCGFDSIPSDLGVLMLHEAGGEMGDTTLVVKALKGGFSGGTFASRRARSTRCARDRAARKADVRPERARAGTRARRRARPAAGRARPEARLDRPIRHGELQHARSSAAAPLAPLRPAAFATARFRRYSNPVTARSPPPGSARSPAASRSRRPAGCSTACSPAPGAGRARSRRASGYFKIEVYGAGRRATVAAKGDPGYAATAVMMGESALCAALDQLPERFGILTPASAMGTALVDRLRAAGMTLTVSE